MFTRAQIGVGGFFGVFSGCLPLTVNLARLPYWRGAIIGIFFGTLTHMLTAFIYLSIVILAFSMLNDPGLHKPESWVFIIVSAVALQCLSSLGCQIMGRYFLAPSGGAPFQRQKLYETLKAKDTGKKSVLHDVVLRLEIQPASPDVRFSWGWIGLASTLSLCSMYIWLRMIKTACLESLFYGIPMDSGWYIGLIGQCLIPWFVLVLAQAAILLWLCRDIKRV